MKNTTVNENVFEMRNIKIDITLEAIQLLQTGDGFARANEQLLFYDTLTIVQREPASSNLIWSYSQLRNWITSFSLMQRSIVLNCLMHMSTAKHFWEADLQLHFWEYFCKENKIDDQTATEGFRYKCHLSTRFILILDGFQNLNTLVSLVCINYN